MIDNYSLWEAHEAEQARRERTERRHCLLEEMEDNEVERLREDTES